MPLPWSTLPSRHLSSNCESAGRRVIATICPAAPEDWTLSGTSCVAVDVYPYWRNRTHIVTVTMREEVYLRDNYGKHFVNAVVVLKLLRVIFHTIFDNEPGRGGAVNYKDMGGSDDDSPRDDARAFLQAFFVLKLAKLFFYGFIWAPLTVYFGGLGSLHRFQRGVRYVDKNGPLKGKTGYCPREVTDDSNSFLYNVYFRVLRLPLPIFLMCWFFTYAMVNVFFACLYYLDVDGFHVERKTNWPTWIEGIVTKHVTSWLTILLYSSSILTNFPGAGADAHSPYTHMLGNAHAMLAQFVSLFWFSACFKRISKPVNVIRWSSVAVISYDKKTVTSAGFRKLGARRPRVLTMRFDVVRPYFTGLIDVKFDLVCARADGLQSPLHSGMQLSLIRKETANLTHGALVQHVIDEESPLFLLDLKSLRNQDVIFNVSLRAVEKNSVKQIFSENLYSAHDNDILWDRAFQDQTYVDDNGNAVYDFTLLNKTRSICLKPEG